MKVDVHIRLMQGDNTGPINIGNPGNLESHDYTWQSLITW